MKRYERRDVSHAFLINVIDMLKSSYFIEKSIEKVVKLNGSKFHDLKVKDAVS